MLLASLSNEYSVTLELPVMRTVLLFYDRIGKEEVMVMIANKFLIEMLNFGGTLMLEITVGCICLI